MKYESLIFDIDGTIWDSRALVAEGYNLQLCEEGLAHLCVDAEGLKPLFGKVLEGIADALFSEFLPEERYPLMERCMAREQVYMRENECRIGYEGVVETIEELAKTHRLFIVSNSEQGYPELCIEKLGLGQWIGGHLCYGDTGTTKAETIRTLIKRHNIGSCIYIGDTQGDYEATLGAGIPFVWADYGFGTPSGWDLRISQPRDLLDLREEGKL